MSYVVPAFDSPVEEFADLAELVTLRPLSRQTSAEHLVALLRRSGGADSAETDGEDDIGDLHAETSQGLASDALTCCERRLGVCAQQSYPFRFVESALQRRNNAKSKPYVFMLVLHLLPPDSQLAEEGRELLLRLCAEAARVFFDSNRAPATARVIGTAANRTTARYRAAINRLTEDIGEGGGFRAGEPDFTRAGLDVVAWKESPDREAGRLVAFGQCLEGPGWKDGIYTLQPGQYVQQFLRESLAPRPLKLTFATAHATNADRQEVADAAGLLFDRIRIALLTRAIPAGFGTELGTWSSKAIDELLA